MSVRGTHGILLLSVRPPAHAAAPGRIPRGAAAALAVAALVVLAGGCSGWPPAQVEEPVLHVLSPTPLPGVVLAKRDLVLEVSVPRASPGFDSAAMAYVQKAFVLDYFAVHRWADAPARMLGPQLTRALEQAGSFRAIVQAPTGVPADVKLDAELLRLQQNFMVRPSRVELTLRLQLIDAGTRRVVGTRVVEVASDAPADDPGGGVVAANAALASALAQAVEFCVTASAGVRPRLQGAP